MPPRVQICESMQQLLAIIEQSRDSIGQWIQTGGVQQSLYPPHLMGAEPLEQAIAQARTLHGLEEEIATIDGLAACLNHAVPLPVSIKRRRSQGRSGFAVNPHAVLRGNLAHAWARTTRQTRPAQQSIAVLVPVSWAITTTRSQILWTTAANLAFASLVEQAGYSVEIWAVEGGENFWRTGEPHHLSLIRLKKGGTPWSTQNVALTSRPSFQRRLLFRLWETAIPQYGEPEPAYGIPMRLPMLQQAVAQSNIFVSTDIRYGACIAAHIDDQPTASHWLQRQLATLGTAA